MNKIYKAIKEKTFFSKVYKHIYYKTSGTISKIFFHLPVDEKKIVFDNFSGHGYGDNPKYIAEELIRQKSDYKMIWLIDNSSKFEFPSQIRPIKINSIRALYARATARVWIDNIRNVHPVKKKKNQLYIQTWHAPFSPKFLEKDAEKTLNEKYISEAKYDGSISDAILANSKLQELQYRKSFWLSDKCEILKYGLPRNDYLVNSMGNFSLVDRIRKNMGWHSSWYYILYAPTFRDDFSTDGYNIDFERVKVAFEKLTKKKCAIVVRLHPNVVEQSPNLEYSDTLINGSLYPDIQELAIASDCVISDYSTSIFDFALINKPAFICALDFEAYKEKRGLLDEYKDFPFPMAYTNEELVDNINNFDRNNYDKNVQEYFNEFPIYDKGNAAEMVVKWINKKIS